MASAIIGGLSSTGFNMKDITIFEPNKVTALHLQDEYSVNIAQTDKEAIHCDSNVTQIYYYSCLHQQQLLTTSTTPTTTCLLPLLLTDHYLSTTTND